MNKAIVAVRESSRASTPARFAVLLTLATYSDKDGNEAFPKWDTLMKKTGAGRELVGAAIREAIKNGEIKCTGQRKSKTKIYSFAPIIHSSMTELSTNHSSAIEPRQFGHRTKDSSVIEPDQAVDQASNKKKKNSPRDARLVGDTGLSRSGSSNNGKAKHVDAKERAKEERFELEQELASLTAKQSIAPTTGTETRIEEVRAQLTSKVPEAA